MTDGDNQELPFKKLSPHCVQILALRSTGNRFTNSRFTNSTFPETKFQNLVSPAAIMHRHYLHFRLLSSFMKWPTISYSRAYHFSLQIPETLSVPLSSCDSDIYTSKDLRIKNKCYMLTILTQNLIRGRKCSVQVFWLIFL